MAEVTKEAEFPCTLYKAPFSLPTDLSIVFLLLIFYIF